MKLHFFELLQMVFMLNVDMLCNNEGLLEPYRSKVNSIILWTDLLADFLLAELSFGSHFGSVSIFAL